MWAYFGVLVLAFGWATIDWGSGAGESGGASGAALEVVDGVHAGWYLLRRDTHLFFDVNCSHGAFSYSFIMQLNDAEIAAYRAQGRAFLDRFAEEIHYSMPGVIGNSSPFAHRNLAHDHDLTAATVDTVVRHRKRNTSEPTSG